MVERVPILHVVCGAQIGWFLGERDELVARARDFEFMDGSQPERCTPIRIRCPGCDAVVSSVRDLQRCFPEPAGAES